jgi:hypothetical protein
LKTAFVLIDFENVQPRNMGLLKGGAFKIKVFVGASQAKVSLEMVLALQTFGTDAEYIQISGNGSNALDFHIAYYIGRLAVEEPGATFHIISKDTGFDPLIKHLKAHRIECKRSATIADIPHIKTAIAVAADSALPPAGKAKPAKAATRTTAKTSPAAKSLAKPDDPVPERVQTVIDNLAKRGAARPRTLKTLSSSIKSLLKAPVTDEELNKILATLKKSGKVAVSNDGKVSYSL